MLRYDLLQNICVFVHLLPLLLVLVLVFVCAAIFVLQLLLLFVSVFFVRGFLAIAGIQKEQRMTTAADV